MSATQDFPTCIQCGALPDSREVESCRFCSAPLPWSDWDLRSRRVYVVVPTNTMDDAIAMVEESSEYLTRSLALKRSHLANRKWRRRQGSREDQLARKPTKVDPELLFYLRVLVCGLFAGFYLLRFAPKEGAPVYLVLVGLSVVAVSLARYWTTDAPPKPSPARAPRQYRSHLRAWPKRKTVMAAGIIELGAPRPRSKRDKTLIREVHLRRKDGDESMVFADVYIDLHAGDVGIATTRGHSLEAFEIHHHVDAETV